MYIESHCTLPSLKPEYMDKVCSQLLGKILPNPDLNFDLSADSQVLLLRQHGIWATQCNTYIFGQSNVPTLILAAGFNNYTLQSHLVRITSDHDDSILHPRWEYRTEIA
jgi:hypothetical protein